MEIVYSADDKEERIAMDAERCGGNGGEQGLDEEELHRLIFQGVAHAGGVNKLRE